jgi:hypothetical protein
MAFRDYSTMVGAVFGDWRVVGIADRYVYIDKDGRKVTAVKMEVRCGCGILRTVKAYDLKRHKSKRCRSCASLASGKTLKPKFGEKNPNWKGYGQIPYRMVSRMLQGARIRGLEVSITPEYLDQKWSAQQGRCALSGEQMTMPPSSSKKVSVDVSSRYASVDRIDSSQGYVPGNVQWVCKTLNLMKNSLLEKEFLKWVAIVHRYKSPATESE